MDTKDESVRVFFALWPKREVSAALMLRELQDMNIKLTNMPRDMAAAVARTISV